MRQRGITCVCVLGLNGLESESEFTFNCLSIIVCNIIMRHRQFSTVNPLLKILLRLLHIIVFFFFMWFLISLNLHEFVCVCVCVGRDCNWGWIAFYNPFIKFPPNLQSRVAPCLNCFAVNVTIKCPVNWFVNCNAYEREREREQPELPHQCKRDGSEVKQSELVVCLLTGLSFGGYASSIDFQLPINAVRLLIILIRINNWICFCWKSPN